MQYYINCLKRSDAPQHEIKELIPDMNMRRRMSRVVRMGVSTAMESLLEFDAYRPIDAIVTATGLGCIADSEKFLVNMLEAEEQMLNPTPFIQSTFNTVGAQIALIRSMHCYNSTFTHRYSSFESALLAAVLCLDSNPSGAVLVGVFDESTPTLQTILQRLNALGDKKPGEGALFFVLTSERLKCSVAGIDFALGSLPMSGDEVMVSQVGDTIWCCGGAWLIADMIAERRNAVVVNDMGGEIHSTIEIRCI